MCIVHINLRILNTRSTIYRLDIDVITDFKRFLAVAINRNAVLPTLVTNLSLNSFGGLEEFLLLEMHALARDSSTSDLVYSNGILLLYSDL